MAAVYASVSFWEYGCCGELPIPGARVSGGLSAVPADDDDRFMCTSGYEWVPDLHLLRFDGWAARWEPGSGDPAGSPVRLRLSWHGDNDAVPTVTGTVTETYETLIDAGGAPTAHRRADTIDRHPNGADPTVGGVEIAIDIETATEPTIDAIAGWEAARDRSARTVQVRGPVSAFDSVRPVNGSRLTLDLDDRRLSVDQNSRRLRGQVAGTVEFAGFIAPVAGMPVSMVVPTDTPDPDRQLLVRLVVDPEFFAATPS